MRPFPSLTILAGILFAMVNVSLSGETIRALEPSSRPIHVRVLFETNPSREVVVSWTTTAEGQSHRLYVCRTPRQGDLSQYSKSLPSSHSAPYTLLDEEAEAGMHAYSHNVFLSGLEPSTRYYLTAVSDGEKSREYYFVTAPNDGRDVQLLAVGDSRVGEARTHPDNNRRRVNALMGRLLEQNPNVVAMIHGGDYTNRAYWSQLYYWLNDHAELTTTPGGRLLPIIPARGNHDRDVGYDEMFWWPNRANDHFYTTHISGDVAVVTLNTIISRGGDQRNWLASELPKLRESKRWVLAQYHHPAYPSVRGFSADVATSVRETWVPLFEEHHIDLVYEAHDHVLKRTYPLFENQIDPERGIVYIGDGGGGVTLRQPNYEWYLEVTGRHFHAHVLTFTEEQLTGRAIDPNNQLVDSFVFSHNRQAAAVEARAEREEADRYASARD